MAQDPFKYFRIEAQELLEQFGKGILELEKGASACEVSQRLLRVAHTLKGASRVVKQPSIAEHAHAIEDILEPFRQSSARVPKDGIDQLLRRLDGITQAVAALAPPPTAEAAKPGTAPREEENRTLRADLAEMDELLEGIGETHAQLQALQKAAAGLERTRQLSDRLVEQLARQGERESVRHGGLDRLAALAAELQGSVGAVEQKLGAGIDQVQRELRQVRAAAEQLRLLPAGGLFTSLERSARDAAQALGKQVAFTATGGDMRLDAHVLEVVRGALVQLVRNAVAHGIESLAERKAASKPAQGRVLVEIRRRGRRVLFRCRDDGRGIDLDAVRRMLQRRGLSGVEAQRLSRDELLQLLLRGGITTFSSVTEIAGRGIGLDLVRDAAQRLGGVVTIETETGQGTTFDLIVPLSVASFEALTVEAAGALVSIPLDAVRRTLRILQSEVSRTEQGESIVCDGRVIPFVPLRRALCPSGGPQAEPPRSWSAVVLEAADGVAAVGVERLLGTATVLLRPLPEYAPADRVVAGASLDADGNPRLVLDPDELVAEARRGGLSDAAPRSLRRSILVIDDSLTTRMLEQSILESAGYQVDTASSAEEALVCAAAKRYALFLVDVEMPGMDGFTFVERIRADPELAQVPAILVTSLSAPEHQQRGKDVGAQGYVIKSEFDQADLLARIQRLVE
jgi:two-component system chemotaxis sensor kinase CheA